MLPQNLRDFLVLPCKRKLQYITSSIDKDQVLRETFDKVQTLQQKNVFLLVDEVQIRPTVSISGGLLSGMAENNRDCKATSILITRRQGTVRVKERQYSDDYYTRSICSHPLRERLAEEWSPSDLCQEGPKRGTSCVSSSGGDSDAWACIDSSIECIPPTPSQHLSLNHDIGWPLTTNRVQYSSQAQPLKLVSVGNQTGDELITPTSPNVTGTQLVELLAKTLAAVTRQDEELTLKDLMIEIARDTSTSQLLKTSVNNERPSTAQPQHNACSDPSNFTTTLDLPTTQVSPNPILGRPNLRKNHKTNSQISSSATKNKSLHTCEKHFPTLHSTKLTNKPSKCLERKN
ncbi:hypothetical protein FHG87_013866 [Trinorchestia longiramus]|nr:hypothetical protein FHG87_013866 [Trinorchestia longiramus]